MAGAAKRKVATSSAEMPAPDAAALATAAAAPVCVGAGGATGWGAAACWWVATAGACGTARRCAVVGGARRGARSSARAAVAGDVPGSAVRRCVTPGWRDGGRAWDDSTFSAGLARDAVLAGALLAGGRCAESTA